MLRHSVQKHTLQFIRPGGTSRGVLKIKDSWFLSVWDDQFPEIIGVGECSIIKGLSPDPLEDLESVLHSLKWNKNNLSENSRELISSFPAIQFAVETALLDLKNNGQRIIYPSDFIAGKLGIKINGLIWMGEASFMKDQIREKIKSGYRCVKLKIGAIDFETEIKLIQDIRKTYSEDDIEIRVDANGAFHPDQALDKLKRLSEFNLHSIEQPIQPGQIDVMAELCQHSPLDIVLDEELIGINLKSKRIELLEIIQPAYIILKPSFVGGLKISEEWINLAKEYNIGWWITSALESNIGLNAIAQWAATFNSPLYQGLGTGQLYSNNISSPLYLNGDILNYDPRKSWGNLLN